MISNWNKNITINDEVNTIAIEYITADDIPVKSVNSQTGDVVLTASSVNAVPSDATAFGIPL